MLGQLYLYFQWNFPMQCEVSLIGNYESSHKYDVQYISYCFNEVQLPIMFFLQVYMARLLSPCLLDS